MHIRSPKPLRQLHGVIHAPTAPQVQRERALPPVTTLVLRVKTACAVSSTTATTELRILIRAFSGGGTFVPISSGLFPDQQWRTLRNDALRPFVELAMALPEEGPGHDEGAGDGPSQ